MVAEQAHRRATGLSLLQPGRNMCRAVLAGLALAVALTAPGPALSQSDKFAGLRELAKDLAAAMEAKANKLHKDGVSGYEPGSPKRQEIDEISKTFTQLASQSAPSARQIDKAGFDLARLSHVGLELYLSIADEPSLRARIESAERDYGMRVFVSPDVVSQGLEILSKLVAAAKKGASPAQPDPPDPPDPPAPDDEADPWDKKDKARALSVEALEELAVVLEKGGDPATIKEVANRSGIRELNQGIYQLYGSIIGAGYKLDELLSTQVMAHFLDTRGPAFEQYRLHAFYGSNHELVIRLGNVYQRRHCSDASEARLNCFTIMTQTALSHARLRQTKEKATALQALSTALNQHEGLRMLLSDADPTEASAVEVKKRFALDLGYLINKMNEFGQGEPEDFFNEDREMIALMAESQVNAYWIAKAAGLGLSRVLTSAGRSMPPRYSFDAKDMLGGLASFFYLGTLELADHRASLAATQILRTAATGDKQDFAAAFDLIDLQVLYGANELEEASKLARAMRTQEAFRQPQSTVKNAILASCQSAREFELDPNASPDGLSINEYALTRLELLIALRTRAPTPAAKVMATIEYEARAVLANINEKEMRASELAAHWPEYSQMLAADKNLQRRTAHALKCLLTRKDVIPRLGMDFVNKGGPERQTLNASVFTLLHDTGLFDRKDTKIGNEDFVLLQAVSIMQAHNGISSATARSAFTDPKLREAMRREELSLTKLTDQLSEVGRGVGFFQVLQSMMDGVGAAGLERYMLLMLMRTKEFETYADLRNQSIATLTDVQKSLRDKEAAVLFALFESKVVTVVIKKGTASTTVASTSLHDMKESVAKLRSSIDFLSPESQALPPAYRADVAWKLYTELIKPVESALAGVDTLYLVAGEDLSPIPFAALVSAKPPSQSTVNFATYRKLKWLGDKYSFVSLPSAHALLRAMASTSNKGDAKLLGVGDPAVSVQTLQDLQLTPMPDTGRLLSRAGKPIDPAPLLQARASYAKLLDAGNERILTAADILLINTHALAAGRSKKYGTKEPAILLAPSAENRAADFLDPPKVMSLNLGLRLVLLLACETAGGRSPENPQPYAGLVNSFFFAGAASVVTTNLPIDPAVTEEFAVHFLRQLRDRQMPSAKALQTAIAEVRCAKDSMACAKEEKFVWAHPAYWSQFTLVGSAR